MRWAWVMLLAGSTPWSFEKDEVGKAPAGFDFVATGGGDAGHWTVAEDGKNKVLAQTDASGSPGRFAMAVAKDASFKDVSLAVRARPVAGTIDQAAGLVWRWQDADNYYLARSNALEGNVRFYRVVDGRRIQIAGKDDVTIKTGEWQTLKIEQRGAKTEVWFNAAKLFEAEDESFEKAGRVGVWIKADSVTWFDDLSAEELK